MIFSVFVIDWDVSIFGDLKRNSNVTFCICNLSAISLAQSVSKDDSRGRFEMAFILFTKLLTVN